MQVACVCRMCKITIESLRVNLAVLPMTFYDMIVGKDFLTKYRATIDCHCGKVIFVPWGNSSSLVAR